MELNKINYLINRTNQLKRWQFASRMKDKAKVHFGQLPLLKFIGKYPGCSQTELAEHFCLSRAGVTKSVRRMMNNGMINRTVSENDARQYCLYLTDKGVQLTITASEVIDEVGELAFKGFSEEEMDVLYDFVVRLSNNLENDYSRGKSLHDLIAESDRLEEEGEQQE